MNARRLLTGGAVVLLFLAGCQTEQPAPTPTADPTAPILPASPTVDPLLPTNDGGFAAGVSNPTLAGLAAEGQQAQDAPTLTPEPPAASLPIAITAADGLALQATLYQGRIRPAPVVVLLHEEGLDRTSWDDLAQRLQTEGYAVLTLDLRGHGDTGGDTNWARAVEDMRAVLQLLGQLSGIKPTQVVIMGSSIGANLALHACADLPGCVGAALLSPGLDYQGITTAEAMVRLGPRAVLIVAGENDTNNPADSMSLDRMAAGDHRLLVLPAAGHGMAMFAAEPGLADTIIGWIKEHVPPAATPAMSPTPP